MFISQSLYYLETYLKLADIIPVQGDMAFMFETQTHWEYNGSIWNNTKQQIRPIGEPGMPGIPGKNGQPGKDGYTPSFTEILEQLENNEEFMNKCKGEQGKPGKDGIDGHTPDEPSIDEIANNIKSDPEFWEKTRGKKGEPGIGIEGKPGKTAEIDYQYLIEELKKDREFIELTKGDKGDKGESTKGEPGIPGIAVNGIDGKPGKDGISQIIFVVDGLYDEIGKDGDFCLLNGEPKRIYQKTNGIWVFKY